MCGLSASFLFAIVSRLVDREIQTLSEPAKPHRAYIEGETIPTIWSLDKEKTRPGHLRVESQLKEKNIMTTEKIRVGIIGASMRNGWGRDAHSWVPAAVPAGLPFNVAQLYLRMSEGIREGKSLSPDFDVAVKRHQLLDVIQKASDTGIRQILERRLSDCR
jgi:hypothetical protein